MYRARAGRRERHDANLGDPLAIRENPNGDSQGTSRNMRQLRGSNLHDLFQKRCGNPTCSRTLLLMIRSGLHSAGLVGRR